MELIKCRVCGAQFKPEEGRCPVCHNLPEGGEPIRLSPGSVKPAYVPPKKKTVLSKIFSYGTFKLAVCLAAAAIVLVPLGKGIYVYYTSPQAYINRGNYKKAYEKASKSERESLVDEMLSAGKYGKAYDMVKVKDRDDIYLEAQIAGYTKNAYEMIDQDPGAEVSSGDFEISGAWHCVNSKYDMYVIALDIADYEDYGGVVSASAYSHYFFFADDGSVCNYKSAATQTDLEEQLGISLDGYESGYDIDEYSSYGDYYDDDDYVSSILTSEYDGARLGRVDSEIVYRVNGMMESKLYDEAEYLGRDKMPKSARSSDD